MTCDLYCMYATIWQRTLLHSTTHLSRPQTSSSMYISSIIKHNTKSDPRLGWLWVWDQDYTHVAWFVTMTGLPGYPSFRILLANCLHKESVRIVRLWPVMLCMQSAWSLCQCSGTLCGKCCSTGDGVVDSSVSWSCR